MSASGKKSRRSRTEKRKADADVVPEERPHKDTGVAPQETLVERQARVKASAELMLSEVHDKCVKLTRAFSDGGLRMTPVILVHYRLYEGNAQYSDTGVCKMDAATFNEEWARMFASGAVKRDDFHPTPKDLARLIKATRDFNLPLDKGEYAVQIIHVFFGEYY